MKGFTLFLSIITGTILILSVLALIFPLGSGTTSFIMITGMGLGALSLLAQPYSKKEWVRFLGTGLFNLQTGWSFLPFWSLGLHRIFWQEGFSYLFDPKERIPMSLMGELWRFPVLLLQVLIPMALLLYLILLIIRLVKKKDASVYLYNMIVLLALPLIQRLLLPHYLKWLVD